MVSLQVTNSTKYAKTTAWVTNEDDGLQTSRSRLELSTHGEYFPGGRMTVRCESNQFMLYKKYSVIELMDDSPRLAQMISPTSVLRSGKWYTFYPYPPCLTNNHRTEIWKSAVMIGTIILDNIIKNIIFIIILYRYVWMIPNISITTTRVTNRYPIYTNTFFKRY